ncbi:MAG TPA: hypothetical protein VFI42_19515 [Thermomicrobiaceae bacterium]|nr:hypothetical protein [Thermomicrobiaceae bacterium]
MQVFEVFRQEDEGEALRHAGSVDAPDEALAIQYAREVYSRRGEATRLWIVPRAAIVEVVDEDFLHPVVERSYRLGEGYRVTVAKRRQLKEAGAGEP